MKICLSFTPFHRPNSIPFGISYLKGYLEKNISNINVKNLDLNVLFFDKIIKEKLNGLCKCCLSSTSCVSMEDLIASGEIRRICARLKKRFSDKKGINRYLNNTFIFEKFYMNISNCYSIFLRNFIERDVLPDIVAKILCEDADKILFEKPDIVGFSILVENNLLYSLALAKIIKAKADIPVILGGAMMAHLDAKELLKAFNFIDFIFHGEGEIALEKFIKTFHLKKYDSIPGIAYRKGSDIQINEREAVIKLDNIPYPDFSDFDLRRYITAWKVLPILSSRGCYWRKCAFCTHSLPYSNCVPCRNRSVKNVVDELEAHSMKFKITHFLFVDETISPRRLDQISAEILKRNIHIYYGAEGMRLENGLTFDVLKKAYSSGLRWLFAGVESVTQRLLDKMDKGTDVETIKKIIEDCYKIGIRPFISYIVGFPSQTENELRKECVFLREYLPYGIVEWGQFKLNQGSVVFNSPDKYGVIVGSQKVLFRIKNIVVHSPEFNFIPKEGLSTDRAIEIAHNEMLPKEKLYPAFDEITHVILSAASVKLSPVDIKTRYFRSCISSAIQVNKIKIKDGCYNHFLLAVSYQKLGQFERALRELEKVEKGMCEETFRARIQLYLGECYERTKRYRNAVDAYEEAIKTFPNESSIYLGLGRAYFHFKKYKKAIKWLRRGVILNGRGNSMRFLLASSYERIGEYKKAIEELRQEEGKIPEDARVNFLLAKCYRNTGQTEQFRREVDRGFLNLKDSRNAYFQKVEIN